MISHFDAVIIGAGPAGWSAALSLRKAGQEVLVVDQASFPRDKVCGGFLGAENQDILREWGIWEELKRQGATEINSIFLAASCGANVLWRKTNKNHSWVGLGVSRRVMDQTFCQVARECGIVFQDATHVERSVREDQRWRLELMSREFHTRSCVTARRLIYAMGVPKIKRTDSKDLIGAYALFQNAALPLDEVGLYFSGGGHAGVNHFENGLTNVCYVVSRRTFDGMNRSLLRVFEYFKRSNPSFSKAFGEAKAVTPWKAVTVSYEPDQAFFENGVFYAGDAAAVIHPIVGGGMTLAIDGGRLLGNLLVNSADSTDAQIAAAYKKVFLKQFNLRIQSSWWLGRAAHQRIVTDGVISAGSVGRKFLEAAFQFNHHSSTLATGSAS